MDDWYDQIEKPVRNIVRLLRDNGFNTFSSCGHKMSVEMEWYDNEGEMRRLYDLMCENGHKDFELRLVWPSSGIGRFMEIKLSN